MQERIDKQEEMEIDLREVLYLIRQKLWIIIVCAVVGGAAMWLYTTNYVVPQYAATSKMYIFSETQLTSMNVSLSSSLTVDFIEVAKSRPVMEEVIEELDLNMSSSELLSCISVSNPEDSHLLIITATTTDPVLSKDIANSMSGAVSKRVAEIMAADEPNIMEEAIVPGKPVDSGLKRNVMMGTLAGAAFVILAILLLYILDDTVKDEEDIEKYLGIKALAAFPKKRKRGKGVL